MIDLSGSSLFFLTCVFLFCVYVFWIQFGFSFFQEIQFYLFLFFRDLSTICHLRLYRPVVHISRSSIGTGIYSLYIYIFICMSKYWRHIFVQFGTAALIWNRPRVWIARRLGTISPPHFLKLEIKKIQNFLHGKYRTSEGFSPFSLVSFTTRKDSATYRD